MKLNELIAAVLTPLIAAGLKYLLGLLGVEIDAALFNTIVTSIVAALLALAGVEAVKAKAPARFR